MVQLSATEIEQARFVSLLSGDPVSVKDDVYIWNGLLVNRATALVAMLRIYSQLPVNEYLKTTLFRNYLIRFNHVDQEYLVKDEENIPYTRGEHSVWFYHVCQRIKGPVAERTEQDIKRLIILLHS